jgi:hypothetical protein
MTKMMGFIAQAGMRDLRFSLFYQEKMNYIHIGWPA